MSPPFVRGARAAVVFLTRVPAGGFPYSDEDQKWAGAHFPLVGALLGVGCVAVWHATELIGPLTGAVAVVGFQVVATGALHEDAVADTADALGGRDREHRLAILKDRHVGAFGVVAVALGIAARLALISETAAALPALLVVAPCLARAAPVYLLSTLDYVTASSLAKSAPVARARLPQALIATGWIALWLTALVATSALPLAIAAAAVCTVSLLTIAAGSWFRTLFGGVTGDVCGATVVVAECGVWFACGCVHAVGG